MPPFWKSLVDAGKAAGRPGPAIGPGPVRLFGGEGAAQRDSMAAPRCGGGFHGGLDRNQRGAFEEGDHLTHGCELFYVNAKMGGCGLPACWLRWRFSGKWLREEG